MTIKTTNSLETSAFLDCMYGSGVTISYGLENWWQDLCSELTSWDYYPSTLNLSMSLRASCCVAFSCNFKARFIGVDLVNKHIIYLSDERFYKYSNSGMLMWSDIYLNDITEKIADNQQKEFNSLVYRIKVGKFLSKLFGFSSLTSSKENVFIEKCSLHFNSYFTRLGEVNIQILPPNKIAWAYDVKNYNEGGGQLNGSCMRYDYCQEKMDFYSKNNISIAVLLENNKVSGRALLWDKLTNVHTEKKNIKLLDRVYAISQYSYRLFDKFAEHNKFITKREAGGSLLYRKVIIPKQLKRFPYLDTMSYLYPQAGLLSNGPLLKKMSIHSHQISLKSTDGIFEDANPERVKDKFTLVVHRVKDCEWVNKYEGFIYKGNIVKIRNGTWHRGDTHIVRLRNDSYELKERCVLVEGKEKNMWIKRSDAIEVYEPTFNKKDKRVYLKSKIFVSKENKKYGITLEGHYILKNDYVVERNGICYAKNDPCLAYSETSKRQLYFGSKSSTNCSYHKWYKDRPFDKIPEHSMLKVSELY